MRRIHIVGVNPRTGTTLLTECMRQCFDIELAAAHEEHIWALRRCRDVYLTKKPRDLWVIGARLTLDKRCFVLCMIRDPRDTVISRHGSKPDEYFSLTSMSKFRGGWRIIQKYARHPRFTLIRYEHLIERPDDVQNLIAARLPFLSKRACFSDFGKVSGDVSAKSALALNGIRPIDPNNQHKWREETDRVAATLEQSGPIDDELLAAGYETDADWMAKAGIYLSPAARRRAAVGYRPAHREVARAYVSAIIASVLGGAGIALG